MILIKFRDDRFLFLRGQAIGHERARQLDAQLGTDDESRIEQGFVKRISGFVIERLSGLRWPARELFRSRDVVTEGLARQE